MFNNNTNYWVQVKKADLSQNYAVIQPNAQRVTVPIGIGEIYDYFLYFSRELKYEGKVIALVEATDRSQANTASVNTANPTYTTTINNVNVPSSNIKPAVMVKNNSNKTVRVYYASTQKTNGSPGGDFVVIGGQSQLISGFEINDDTARQVAFAEIPATGTKKVSAEPAPAGRAFYPAFRLLYPIGTAGTIAIPYNGPAITAAILGACRT